MENDSEWKMHSHYYRVEGGIKEREDGVLRERERELNEEMKNGVEGERNREKRVR